MTETGMQLAWDSERRKESTGRYERERSADPYHSWRWTKLAKRFKAEHPLCAQCLREGRYTAAAVVDHIEPYPICKDFYDERNLQSLCEYHNIEKGNHDKKLIIQWKRLNEKH